MRHLHAIAAYLAVLTGISLAAAIVQGFTLLRLADCAFLVGLVSLILSGIYYLKRQGAYAGLGNVSKKFLYAISELFGGKDHIQQRRAMGIQNRGRGNLALGCEPFVASAVLLALDYLLIYTIF